MYIILSILLVLSILYIVCVNTLDKWRFRADRQYPYVRELMDEWEQVTRRLLDAAGGQVPDVHVAGQKHPWDAVAAADQLAAACQALDLSSPLCVPLLARQAELEEELDVFLEVYNGLARSYNKALGRPVVRQLARLRGWQPWPALDFCPGR